MRAAADRSTAPRLITDVHTLRGDFPGLSQKVHGHPLAYLDSAASSQVPQPVLDAMLAQQAMNHANIHRGVHELAERATRAYEDAREKVRRFLNAAEPEEIVFTRGTTESINLVASSLGSTLLRPGDEVLITWMEHHSNIVPWQLICARTGARLVPVPITATGEIDLDVFERHLNERTKIVSIVHVSNALGTVNPVKTLAAKAHAAGAVVLIDGAQSAPRQRIDVADIDCDFYAFSGHKIFGPTGVGVLFGRKALLESMPVYQGGGGMIGRVTFERTTFADLPYKFEAGTPDIAGAIGLAAALDYLTAIGIERVASYEDELLTYATGALREVPGLRLTGTAPSKASVLSFVLGDVHPHDIGTILDREGVAVRAGHHCCQPLMTRLGVPATARASLALYNTREDVDALVAALHTVEEVFG